MNAMTIPIATKKSIALIEGLISLLKNTKGAINYSQLFNVAKEE